MTLDITVAPPDTGPGGTRRQIAQYTGPSAYVAGGDEVDPEDVRMGKIFGVFGGLITSGSATRLVVYVPSTGKLQIFVPSTGAEAAGDLSTYSGRLEFVGQ